jgi:hypothetical protein
MLLGDMGDTLVGTELYDRVRRLASTHQPLGFSAVRECLLTLDACARIVEMKAESNWPVVRHDQETARYIVDRARDLKHVRSAGQSFAKQHPNYVTVESKIATHFARSNAKLAMSAVGPTFSQTPLKPLRHAESFSGGAAIGLSPQLKKLNTKVSFGDMTTLAMNASAANYDATAAGENIMKAAAASAVIPETLPTATTTPRTPGGLLQPPQHHFPRPERAIRAVITGMSNILWELNVCQLLLQELANLHYDIAVARSSWRWLVRRSSTSRYFYRLFVTSWSALLRHSHKLFLSRAFVREVTAFEDRRVHDALNFCKASEHNVTHAIGVVHAVITQLRDEVLAAVDVLQQDDFEELTEPHQKALRAEDAFFKAAQRLDDVGKTTAERLQALFGTHITDDDILPQVPADNAPPPDPHVTSGEFEFMGDGDEPTCRATSALANYAATTKAPESPVPAESRSNLADPPSRPRPPLRSTLRRRRARKSSRRY